MKKSINLLPPSVKYERKMKAAKQSIVYFVVACAGSSAFFNRYEKHLETQISDFENQINTYKTHQSQSEELNKKIQSTVEQKKSISTSSFPYHRFLYFITTNATEDMRILSVQSISPNQENSNQALGQGGAETNTGDSTVQNGTQATTDTNEATATANTSQAGTETATNTALPADSGASAQTLDSPIPGGTDNALKGTDTNTVEEKSPFIFDTSEIYIRGYSIYPDSIAVLANKISQESYVSSVTVTKVRDYYTGLKNFKLFEIKVTYQ